MDLHEDKGNIKMLKHWKSTNEYLEFIITKLVSILEPFMAKDSKLKEAYDIVRESIIFQWNIAYLLGCE